MIANGFFFADRIHRLPIQLFEVSDHMVKCCGSFCFFIVPEKLQLGIRIFLKFGGICLCYPFISMHPNIVTQDLILRSSALQCPWIPRGGDTAGVIDPYLGCLRDPRISPYL